MPSSAPTSLPDNGGLEPPPGVISDIAHAHNGLAKYNIACQVLCFLFVGMSVLARIYTKVFVKAGLEIEDYACLVAWAFALVVSGIALACIDVGGGVHMWDVAEGDIESFLRLQYFSEMVYYFAAFFTKASILFLIARVFRPHRKAVLLTRCLIGLMVLYYLPAFFIKLLRCHPIQMTWEPEIKGTCVATEYSILFADCIISLVSDVGILVLPIPLVLELQTTLKRRLRILSVFAGGILAIAAIVARIIVVLKLNGEDHTYTVTVVMLLAIAEVNIGIICSCLPVLPSFYKHVLKSAKTVMSKSSTYHELEAWGPKGSAVERARPSDVEKGKEEVAVTPALHQQYLGQDKFTQVSSTIASGGLDSNGVDDGSWCGDGILKTVELERAETSAVALDAELARPQNAVLPAEQLHAL